MQHARYEQILERWDDFDVILAPSYAAAASLNKAAAARSRSGAFGVIATTLGEWVEKLWEQEGDGRAIIDEPRSQLVFQSLIEQGVGAGGELAKTRNLAVTAARCVRQGSGIASFERALAGGAPARPLSAAEEGLVRLIAAYRERIGRLGYIDAGAASAWLGEKGAELLPAGTRVCFVGDAPLDALAQQVLAALANVISFEHLTTDGAVFAGEPAAVKALAPERELVFALAEGPYAQAQLIDKLLDSCGDGPVAITCTRPLELYRPLRAVFEKHGLTGAAKGRRPVLQCGIGRVFSAAMKATENMTGLGYLLPLSDVLAVEALGVFRPSMWQLQAAIRADRLSDKGEVLARMCELSPLFAAFLQLVREPSEQAVRQIEDMLKKDPASAIEFEPIARYYRCALEVGIAPARASELIMPLLQTVQVSVTQANVQLELGEAPQVRVLTQAQAASLDPGEVSTFIACELNNASYPAARRGNAVSTLLQKLGVSESEPYIDRQRRIFNALVELPEHRLVLSRPLKDVDLKEQYPCAMYEEFLLANGHISEPKKGEKGLVSAGEEKIAADLLGAEPATGQADALARPDDDVLAAKRIASSIKKRGTLAMSPSNLELYHECPRKWFLSRWLNTGDTAEGFDAMGRGTFIHDCIGAFYHEFNRRGHDKVDQFNLEEAKALMPQVVAAVREEHLRREPGGFQGRYVAMEGLAEEEHEFDRILDDLVNVWLPEESSFLGGTGFIPVLFEYAIDDLGIEVGGVPIRGRMDRIDMDEKGRAIVVDFKGSVGKEHDGYLDASEVDEDGDIFDGKKIQTYVYAAALAKAGRLPVPEGATAGQRRRIEAFNGEVVGAAYFSYKGKLGNIDKRAGAVFSPDALRADSLRVVESARSKIKRDLFPASEITGEPGFFDYVERMVERIASEQRDGFIQARPPKHDAKTACKYCPDTGCARREG